MSCYFKLHEGNIMQTFVSNTYKVYRCANCAVPFKEMEPIISGTDNSLGSCSYSNVFYQTQTWNKHQVFTLCHCSITICTVLGKYMWQFLSYWNCFWRHKCVSNFASIWENCQNIHGNFKDEGASYMFVRGLIVLYLVVLPHN